MINDGSAGGPPRYVPDAQTANDPATGPARASSWTRWVAARLVLAGPVALVLAALLTVGIGFAVDAVIPKSCTGDSCLGTPGLFAGILSTPVTAYLGWAAALLTLRIGRPWLVALAAAALTVFVLVAFAIYRFSGAGAEPAAAWAVAAAALLIAGPGAGLAAGITVFGTGWLRAAAIPGTVLLVIVGGLLAVMVLVPLRQASAVTKYVPQPYRYDDPALRLVTLTLTSSLESLELDYFAVDPTGDQTISVTEYRAPGGDLQAAANRPCAPPTLGTKACVRVPSAAPTLGLWVTAPDSAYQVVVLRADALLVVSVNQRPTAPVALDVAARLRPDSAANLISSARTAMINDVGA